MIFSASFLHILILDMLIKHVQEMITYYINSQSPLEIISLVNYLLEINKTSIISWNCI